MGELRYNCPFCVTKGKGVDTKRHLCVNDVKNVAHCFRCGFGSQDAARALARHHIIVRHSGRTGVPAVSYTNLEKISFPPEYKTNWSDPVARRPLDYLLERRISRVAIGAYALGYCEDGRYGGRIILPIYWRGTLLSYQARDWTGAQQPKYLGPPGPRRSVLFNLDRASTTGILVLVEGIFDALSILPYGVAMLGKQLTVEQTRTLLATKPRRIILALDADAQFEASTLLHRFPQIATQAYTRKTEIFQFRSKDLNEAPAAERERLLEHCRRSV